MSAASGTKVEKFIGYRYPNGVFYAGPGQPMLSDPACAVAINLDAAWTPPSCLVLITRTTTPGPPTLEAVPLREGDVLQGPYVVLLDGGYYRNTSRDAGPLAGAFKYEYIENAISMAGYKGGEVCRLLERPGEPVVTHTVVPLTEACGVTP